MNHVSANFQTFLVYRRHLATKYCNLIASRRDNICTFEGGEEKIVPLIFWASKYVLQ